MTMAFQHQAGTPMECLSTDSILLSAQIEYNLETLLVVRRLRRPQLPNNDLEFLFYCAMHWADSNAIPITLHKEPGTDGDGKEVLKCGFKIGGGIDQDYRRSPNPQNYSDNGIYVTQVVPNSPAERAGLKIHDKILQSNGYDLTMVTHKKAVDYIKKHPVLNLLIARKGVTSS